MNFGLLVEKANDFSGNFRITLSYSNFMQGHFNLLKKQKKTATGAVYSNFFELATGFTGMLTVVFKLVLGWVFQVQIPVLL